MACEDRTIFETSENGGGIGAPAANTSGVLPHRVERSPGPGGTAVTEVLKVSARSNPHAVAGALAAVVRAAGCVEIQVVGAGALNQAIKAIAIARGFATDPDASEAAPTETPADGFDEQRLELACRPMFAAVTIDGEARTAIRLLVERHPSVVDGWVGLP